ncbi:MAG: MnmC family methyltransferase [Campylobacterota bacterium]|nr:MnmC family methyltransferase [Campylobacterota bacterium]
MSKHIVPALTYQKEKQALYILDICFGIGYNTLATLYYLLKNSIDKKVYIYSPEFDEDLIKSLKDFNYPKEFEPFKKIIEKISNNFKYEDENLYIEVYKGDARRYLKELKKRDISVDIVYQDPFSSDVNKALWTKEYFTDIKAILSSDAVITTYSIATPVRLSMWENGISIYEYKADNTNRSTMGLNKTVIDKNYKYIDMELKKERNKDAKALYDKG